MGGYELVYPLPDTPENVEKIKEYQVYGVLAQDIYDSFNNGRRKNGTMDRYKDKVQI